MDSDAPSLSDQIRAMKTGKSLFFPAAKINSVKAIASRIGGTAKPLRTYITRQEEEDGVDGVTVWRLK